MIRKAATAFSLVLLLGCCASQSEAPIFVAVPTERAIGAYGDWNTNYESERNGELRYYSFVDSLGDLNPEIFATEKASLYVTAAKSKPYILITAEIDSIKDPLMRISRSKWTETSAGLDNFATQSVEGFAEFTFDMDGFLTTRTVRCYYNKGGSWVIRNKGVSEVIHHLNDASKVSVALSLFFWGEAYQVTLEPIKFDSAGVTHFETMQIPVSALNET